MIKKVSALLIIIALSHSISIHGFGLKYELTTDSGSTSLIWDITEENNAYVLRSTDPKGKRTFISGRDGSIRNFIYQDLDNNIYFEGKREELSIIVSSFNDTDSKENSFISETGYWYQPLGFCFFDFACSDEKRREFFMVNPENLKPVSFVIKKSGTETIYIRGEKTEAIKAELRLRGIMAAFWHGTYWLNPDNGILLRYIGTFGPGTEKTVMELTDLSGEIFF